KRRARLALPGKSFRGGRCSSICADHQTRFSTPATVLASAWALLTSPRARRLVPDPSRIDTRRESPNGPAPERQAGGRHAGAPESETGQGRKGPERAAAAERSTR